MASRCFSASWQRPTWRHSPYLRCACTASSQQRKWNEVVGINACELSSTTHRNAATAHDQKLGCGRRASWQSCHRYTHSAASESNPDVLSSAERARALTSLAPPSRFSAACRTRFGTVSAIQRMPVLSGAGVLAEGGRVGVQAGIDVLSRQERGYRDDTASGGIKRKVKKRTGTLNESIRAETVLVVWDRPDIGKRDSVTMRTKMALKIAKDNKLDLVLLNKTAQPPVCEIVDYGVEQYRKKRSEKEKRRRTRKQLTKGVQLKGLIAQHDFERKMKNTVTYLERGDKVKITLEANMKILRRKLDCLDDLEARVLDKLDANAVNIVRSPTSNMMAKREMMCSYKKARVSQKLTDDRHQTKGPGEPSPTVKSMPVRDAGITPGTESDATSYRPGLESNTDSGTGSRPKIVDEIEAKFEGEESNDEESEDEESDDEESDDEESDDEESDDEESDDEESDDEESDDEESDDEESDDEEPGGSGSDGIVRSESAVDEPIAADKPKTAETPGQTRRRVAMETALANVAAACARLKDENTVDLGYLVREEPSEGHVEGEKDDVDKLTHGKQEKRKKSTRRVEDELGDSDTEEGGGGIWNRGYDRDYTPEETEADLLYMRRIGAFDGMDEGEVQEYHNSRRSKKKRRFKPEVDILFKDEDRWASKGKGKGKGKGKKRSADDDDASDWEDFGDDDEMGQTRRMKKWDAQEAGLLRGTNTISGVGAGDGSARGDEYDLVAAGNGRRGRSAGANRFDAGRAQPGNAGNSGSRWSDGFGGGAQSGGPDGGEGGWADLLQTGEDGVGGIYQSSVINVEGRYAAETSRERQRTDSNGERGGTRRSSYEMQERGGPEPEDAYGDLFGPGLAFGDRERDANVVDGADARNSSPTEPVSYHARNGLQGRAHGRREGIVDHYSQRSQDSDDDDEIAEENDFDDDDDDGGDDDDDVDDDDDFEGEEGEDEDVDPEMSPEIQAFTARLGGGRVGGSPGKAS